MPPMASTSDDFLGHRPTITDGSTGAGADGEPPIDLAQAEARFGGAERWGKLLGIYLEDTGDRIGKIIAAVDARDLDTVRKEAHSVKGASAQVGAEPMRRRAEAAELAAREGREDEAYDSARLIPAEFERFRAHVGVG